MKMFKFVFLSILGAGSLFAGNYNIDTSHSSVGFKVKHLMISYVKGSFDSFNGSFDYDEKTNTLKSLNGTIEVSSINTSNKKRDDHLRAPDFFDVEKYPKITFELKSIKGDKVSGILTMRNISKMVILDFENNGTIKDPWGNTRAGFELIGKIKRSDFGLTWNKVLEAGGVAVGDIVKLDIQIEGILKK